MKIKCTYEKCFKHFATEEAMITHKKKDPTHSYCARCDIDCGDDMLLFIHQLGSSAHVCCPVCAQEFKSTAGRDLHVESTHRSSQKIDCAGCGVRFHSASSLMSHIESDQCKVIRQEDFQAQRVEQQVSKEGWETQTEPHSLSRSAHTGNALVNVDETQQTHPGAAHLEQFPPLTAGPTAQDPGHNLDDEQSLLGARSSSNLIDFDASVVKRMGRIGISDRTNLPQHTPQALPTGKDGVGRWLDAVTSAPSPPSDNHSDVASLYNKKLPASVLSENIQPAAIAQPNLDAPHQHIRNLPAHSVISSTSRLDPERFWDNTKQRYVCSSAKCLLQFTTPAAFRQHLLTGVHTNGRVACPSCLKKFATTAAWVAHTESPSKRCDIRNSSNFNYVMREITGGVLGTHGFMEDGTVKFVAPKIGEWSGEADVDAFR